MMPAPWMKLLGKAAPWIGGAVGGPAGAMLAKTLVGVFGLDPDAGDSEIESAIMNATPEQIVALKQAEQDFQARMKELGFDHIQEMEALAVDDRKSAREREVSTGDPTPMILSYLVSVGFFGLLIFSVIHGLPTEGSELISGMIGVLGSGWVSTITYYFGSSSGSQSKNKLLAKAPAIA